MTSSGNNPTFIPTAEEIARRQTARELARRANTSIFNDKGQVDEFRAREMSASGSGDIYLGEYLHLDGVEWASEPDGPDHCQNLARLVEYMASLPESVGGVVGGPLEMHDCKVLHATAMLYATGKEVPSDYLNDPEALARFAAKSAANAERFFRNGGGQGTYWGKSEVREDVCRLIFRHTDLSEVKSDKRLQVLADAIRFETARYHPNTAKGLGLLKERWTDAKWWMRWSADKANARQWMIYRGWK